MSSTVIERPLRLTPSADCVAALATLRPMLEDFRASAGNSAAAHAPLAGEGLWWKLAADGWTLAGRDLGGGGAPPARDVVELADAWGQALGAAPFLETLLLARWHGALAGDAPASFAIPLPDGGALLPFGGTATAHAQDAQGGWHEFEAVPAARDDFAPSLPIWTLPPQAARITLLPEPAREAACAYVATAVGCAERCLARTIEHTSNRIAYGRAVVTFQALRHILADMYRDTELARSGVVGALHEPDWVPLLEHCADLAQRVIARAIQLHGGMGFTWEMGLHFQSRHVLAVRKLLHALAQLPR